MEWNAESNGVLRRMRTWYHLSSYDYNNNIIEVLDLWCCIIRILSRGGGGDGVRGRDWSTPLPMARTS